MAITSYYDSTHTPTSYLIICPYEGKMNTGYNIVNVAPKLTMKSELDIIMEILLELEHFKIYVDR